MNLISNHLPTAELQALDTAHHMHPFTDGAELAAVGPRVITRAKGVMLTDSEGVDYLDAMAGLWCVNIGYGRDELAQVAARQMSQLPYYIRFFKPHTYQPLPWLGGLRNLHPGTSIMSFSPGQVRKPMIPIFALYAIIGRRKVNL